MEDNHSRLTSEVSNLMDLLGDTKYGNAKEHPVVHKTIKRVKKALEVFGRRAISVASVDSSEEVRSKIYDKELEPLITKIRELTTRYQMPALVAIEWGDEGKSSVMCQPEAQKGGIPADTLRLVMLAADVGGNVDLLFAKLLAFAKAYGHSSTILKEMGVPEFPEGAN